MLLYHASFKPSTECVSVASKTTKVVYHLRRTVGSRNPELLLPLFEAIVRTHLDYAVQGWSPNLVKDQVLLEDVQWWLANVISESRDMSYEG